MLFFKSLFDVGNINFITNYKDDFFIWSVVEIFVLWNTFNKRAFYCILKI